MDDFNILSENALIFQNSCILNLDVKIKVVTALWDFQYFFIDKAST